MQCIRKGFVKKLRLLKVKTRIGVIIKFQLIRKIVRGKQRCVPIIYIYFSLYLLSFHFFFFIEFSKYVLVLVLYAN